MCVCVLQLQYTYSACPSHCQPKLSCTSNKQNGLKWVFFSGYVLIWTTATYSFFILFYFIFSG